ncbi:MAG: FtsX-like permease family protein, partial [Candidatus Zixiibacteriota bacterium]
YRSKEAGMRRVAGASRGQLALQFFGEAGLLTGISLLLSCLIAELLLPLVNDIAGLRLTLGTLADPLMLVGVVGFGLVVSLISGSYPSVIFSRIRPVSVLRGDMTAGAKGVAMRRILVVGQSAASVLLILATMTIFGQLDHMKNRPLGFDAEQKLILPIPEHVSIADNYEALKNEFMSHPTIMGASALSLTPGRMYKIHGFNVPDAAEARQHLYHAQVDHDFISQYKIELIAGRNFSREIGADFLEAGIINEAAVRKFGWNSPDSAIGKTVLGPSDNRMTIIGVMKDFHFQGLQSAIKPLYIDLDPQRFQNISLTLNTAGIAETLGFVERKWQQLFPSSPFEYYFLDADFDRHYRSEERVGGIVGSFGLLGIAVACLGLFGLAAFMAEQRTKEIGIRKVLGSSVLGIIQLLIKEFVVLVAIANVIAWPIAYYVMNRWLQDFAYRIELGIGTFVLAGLAAMLIALLTFSYQAIRAARANPVEALKYE